MTIKERYRQFRQWQKNPAKYQRSKEAHHCINCGDEFQGDFCPTCGQKWDIGSVSWDNLRQEWMDLWGLGTRSLPFTIVQLLLRPGYLIGEYITGKRRCCFPPFNMFVLVALVVYMIGHWLNLNYTHEPSAEQVADPNVLGRMNIWILEHEDFTMLLVFLLIILPTYIVFRHAPRLPRHTIPQGFFIQVFNATLYLCLLLPFGLICKMIALGEVEGETIEDTFQKLIVPMQLFVNYKQLFGYGVWGTLWRVVACYVLWKYSFYLVLVIITLVFSSLFHEEVPIDAWSTGGAITTCIILCVVLLLTLCIVFFANWRSRRILQRKRQQ